MCPSALPGDAMKFLKFYAFFYNAQIYPGYFRKFTAAPGRGIVLQTADLDGDLPEYPGDSGRNQLHCDAVY